MIRIAVITSVLWVMPVMLTGIAEFGVNVPGVLVNSALAEEKKKTRRVPALREQTHKKLAEAQIMIDPESIPREEGEPPPVPTGTPRDAVNMLNDMLQRRGLNPYEKAQIWNTLAYAYFTLGETDQTINAYQQVLAQETITEALEENCLRALFQLYYGEEQYRRSIEYIERWETFKGEMDPNITFIKSTAYYYLEDYRKALDNALLVEKLAIETDKVIKENWWHLQVVLYSEFDDYDNIIPVLKKLIINYPQKQYWMHLAAIYSEKEWEEQSLSTYYAIHEQGMLTRENELVMLSQRLLNAEVPYEAALILEQGIEEGIVEENLKNLKLLAQSYTMAQEMTKAIDSWQDATKYAEDGEIHYRLAQALANENRHEDAIKAYRDALDTGGIRNVSDVQFWLAISLMNLEQWDGATRAFREAQKDREKNKMVSQYLRYITGEKRRQRELREMLEEEII